MDPPPLKCPQCGAPIAPDEDDALLNCAFCGTRIFLDASHAVRHFLIEPILDGGKASEAIGRWLKNREVVGTVTVRASELVFFPMWQITAGASDRLVPGAGALFAGLDKVEIPAGDRKLFSTERVRGPRGEAARCVEATVPLEAALKRLSVDDAPARLVHVPLHLVTYACHGVDYTAAVDACSAAIYPFTVPRSSEGSIDAKFAGLLGAGLVLNLAALSFFGMAPLFSLALLAGIAWGLYAFGVRLARWMES